MKIAKISRYQGYFAAFSLLMFLLLLSSVISLNVTLAQTDGQFPQSIIVSTSTDTTPHLLKLKGTQQGGTETRVSGFSIDTTSAVGAQANSQLLVLVTDSSLRVMEAKVRTASNQVINLVPATSQQAGAFSLANLPAGVYTLDVITQKGNAKAAYGGVLSIGNQPATIIEETTKRVTNEYGDLILVFLPPENPPIICPDGSTVPPGEDCPPDPCDVPNPPPECEVPDPCDVPNPPPECGEEPPGLFADGEEPGNGEELRNGEDPEQPDEEEESEDEEEEEDETEDEEEEPEAETEDTGTDEE